MKSLPVQCSLRLKKLDPIGSGGGGGGGGGGRGGGGGKRGACQYAFFSGSRYTTVTVGIGLIISLNAPLFV